MSTRCQVRIKYDGFAVNLYHHCDGYFSGVGADLRERVVQALENGWSPFRFLAQLLEDREYETTDAPHGDIEYFYMLDFDKGEFTGYGVRFGCWDGLDFHEAGQVPKADGEKIDLSKPLQFDWKG